MVTNHLHLPYKAQSPCPSEPPLYCFSWKQSVPDLGPEFPGNPYNV